MGDNDWLEHGHGGGEGLTPMIKGSTQRIPDRVSIRNVLRGPDTSAPRRSRRRTKALVGWLLYCCTAVGGTAAAFTVRDTLFPSLASPPRSPVLWANNVDSTLSSEPGSTSSALKESALEANTVPVTTASTIATSVVDPTAPSVSTAGEGPATSVDNHGSGGDGPQTGTTVAQPTPSGPGTTVDDHPTDTSTPGSASTPSSPDATPSSASTPDPSDSGHQNGKGGGGPTTTTIP